MSPGALLTATDLRVGFATEGGLLQAVDGVSFSLAAGARRDGCGLRGGAHVADVPRRMRGSR